MNCIGDGSYLDLDPSKYHASERIVQKLKKFCDETNTKIVISSNWRKFKDNDFWPFKSLKFFNPLPKLREQLKGYIVDDLPHIRHTTKAEAMILWFEETDFKGNFVIFDDDLREKFHTTHDYHISEHFVLTDIEKGLTDGNIEQAKKILGK